ncbi:MAG: hypothetical protein RBT65_17020 [Methanolobus sp.]|nr:hypothetical protein [Methanolobus sp.]
MNSRGFLNPLQIDMVLKGDSYYFNCLLENDAEIYSVNACYCNQYDNIEALSEKIQLSDEQEEDLRQFRLDCNQELSADELFMLKKVALLTWILKYLNTGIAIFIGSSIFPMIIAIVRYSNTGNLMIFVIAITVSISLFIVATNTIFSEYRREHKFQAEFYDILKNRI